MARKSPYLSEEVYKNSQESLKKLGRTGEISRRLNAIISSYTHSISEVARIYNTTNKTIRLWIKKYKEQGVVGLETSKGRGRKPIFDASDIEQITKVIAGNSAITIKELRLIIEEQIGKKASKSTCHNIMAQCGFSYKTARKRHYKSDPVKQDEFKKN